MFYKIYKFYKLIAVCIWLKMLRHLIYELATLMLASSFAFNLQEIADKGLDYGKIYSYHFFEWRRHFSVMKKLADVQNFLEK